MRSSVFQRRIPTLFGVALVGVGIFISSWFLQTGVLFPTQAASGATPLDVRISNVRDTGFTLSYRTTEEVIGYVVFGKSPDETLRGGDMRDRDQPTPSEQLVHSITLENLEPGTKYYYRIYSGGKEYLKNGIPFEFVTPVTLSGSLNNPLNLSGSIQQEAETQSLVYVSVADSQVLSVLTEMDGSFVVSSQDIRSKDFSSFAKYDESSTLTILITNGVLSSKISSSISVANPLPAISLSQNYDFTLGIGPVGSFDASDSASLAGFPSILVEDDQEESESIEILTPGKDEGFSDQQPRFDGSALPKSDVEIEINSDEKIKTSVKSNSRGAWNFRPTAPLSPGEHTITVRSRDSFGILKEISQSFTVYAEGSQFTDPSVSPVRAPITTATPSPTARINPTSTPRVTPTSSIEPTIMATVAPTVGPRPVVTQINISTAPPIPEAGDPLILLSGLVGVMTVGVGLFVLFMSRGGAF